MMKGMTDWTTAKDTLRTFPVHRVCTARRNSAWSPLRSAASLAKFFFITSSATATAWYAHPHLLNVAAHVLHLDFKDSVTAFQTSFFSFLSLVFAIYSGNTMAFLYDVGPPSSCQTALLSTVGMFAVPDCSIRCIYSQAFQYQVKCIHAQQCSVCVRAERALV